MTLLRQCSKGKYVQEHHNRLENELNNILRDIPKHRDTCEEVRRSLKCHRLEDSFISAPFRNYSFILDGYSQRMSEEWFYTPIVTTLEGLQWRLKVYPFGIRVQRASGEPPKMKKKHSRNEEYLSIFIEYVSGNGPSSQKHQITVVNQRNPDRSLTHDFES